MNNKVSIIIATKNEELNIARCIKSIQSSIINHQSLIEVIVVDNYSTDQTGQIAKKMGAKVFEKGPERSSQRNFGAQKATGQYLVFLDADMSLETELISECLNLAQKGFGSIILSEKIIPRGYWEKCRALEKSCYLGDDLIEAARFYERRLFEEAGGYDENLIASEDWDLHQRVKKSKSLIGRTKSFVQHNEKETNPLQAAKKKYYYGLNLASYLKKHPALAFAQYQPLRPALLRHWPKLLLHPILTCGLVILKSSEYIGGGSGLIVGRLR
ncbi:MAG: glycosyltransferase [bacterium]|nr:glycosyltransferase [bacterium]